MWTTRIALLIGLLGVLTLLVNVAAAIGPNYSIAGGVLVALGVTTHFIRDRIYRHRSPKSAAFEAFIEFGPAMRIPRPERLAKLFPRISREEIAAWIGDFELVDKEIWRLAEEGGNTAYTDDEIMRHLKSRFQFLEESALNAAAARISYYVWHEGYALPETNPKRPIL